MKISAVSSVIESFVEALALSGSGATSAAIRSVLSLFKGRENKPLADFLKLADAANPLKEDEIRPKVGEASSGLKSLRSVVKAVGKPPLVADLDALIEALDKHKDISFEALQSAIGQSAAPARKKAALKPVLPLNDDLVQSYVRRLNAALGDNPAFLAVHHELQADKKATRIEVVAIASQFSTPIAPSTSRPKALSHIFGRHRWLMDFDARSASIGRRVA